MIEKGDIFMRSLGSNAECQQTPQYKIDREKLLKILNSKVLEFQTKWNAMVFVESGENVQLQPIEIPRVCVICD